jgi:tetratricopeptide (TPR) repeat protein
MESAVESHASAADRKAPPVTRPGSRALGVAMARADIALAIALAAALAAAAFVANGGLQLGPATGVEIAAILIGAVLIGASLVFTGLEARVHGGAALAAVTALAALTALSIVWSLYPSDSWVEANRTLAYAATFAAGLAAVRLARDRWRSVLWGILLAVAAVSLYGLATKVAPAWLAEDEIYARLREPFGYWNAVGVMAAMGIPVCLWIGTRERSHPVETAVAYPMLALLIVTMLLSFSRGSIFAALVGAALWLVFVPLRLRTLAVLLPAALAAGVVTVWAFSQGALTDDRVALADRKDAGVEFGLILLVMCVLLAAAGLLIRRRAERRPLSEPARRRAGIAALAALATVPLVVLVALAFSDRGIGGTVSDRWDDLTEEQTTPQNDPGRLIETGNVRTIYWARALDVWRAHDVAGAGAGGFDQAQLRYRDQPAQGRHAHGFVHQTLADLGLIGLALSLLAAGAWLYAVARTLALRRGPREWPPERTGLAALALVAIVFGVHSAIDWTWFVPAVTMTGLFAAGWVAGRGPIDDVATAGPPNLSAVKPGLPRRRGVLARRLAGAATVVALAALAALVVAQPWRAENRGDEALRLVDSGDFAAARAAALDAHDIDPLSVEPYFELAVVEESAGNRAAARKALEDAVRLQPARPEAWRRLGEYYLNRLSQPDRAIPVLRGALFLDPFSNANRAAYVYALRARDVEQAEQAERERDARRRTAAARRAQAAP